MPGILRLICFLALLMGMETDSSSRPPNPPHIAIPLASQNSSETAQPNQAGTEQSPIFVKIVPAQETNPPTNNQQEGVKVTAEDRIADYTRQLTWVTGLLVLVTACLGGLAWRQEKNFVGIERPYVFYATADQKKTGLNGREFQTTFINCQRRSESAATCRSKSAARTQAIEPPISGVLLLFTFHS